MYNKKLTSEKESGAKSEAIMVLERTHMKQFYDGFTQKILILFQGMYLFTRNNNDRQQDF